MKRTTDSASVSRVLREAASVDPRAEGTNRVILPPRSSAPLIGRDAELKALVELSQASGGQRIILHGDPGLGKSSLALEVAHALADTNAFETILWLDCQVARFRGGQIGRSSLTPHSFDDLVRELAVGLDAGAALRERGGARLQTLRRELAGHRTLIVIDDIGSVEPARDVEDFFLSLPDSVNVLATGHSSGGWPRRYRLEPLGEEAAGLLLHQLLHGDDIPEADRAAALSLAAGVPLALEWLARRLQGGLTASDISRALDDDAAAGGGLYGYFLGERWNKLRADEGLLRRMLVIALAAGPIERDRLVGIFGDSARRTTLDAIEQLAALNLLRVRGVELSILPIVRRFVLGKERATQDVFDSTVALWLANLAEVAARAAAAPTWTIGFGELEALRLEFFAVLDWCAKHAEREPMASAGAALFSRISYFLYCYGYWDDLVAAAAWAIPSAADSGAWSEATEGLLWTLKAIRERGGLTEATQTAERWRPSFSSTPASESLRLQVVQAGLRKRIHDGVASSQSAEYAHVLSAIAEELSAVEDTVWSTRAMMSAGNIWTESGDEARAVRAFAWITERSGARRSAWEAEVFAVAQCNMGILANRGQRYEEALELLHSNLPALAQQYDQAVASAELAFAYSNLGATANAIDALRRSRQLLANLGIVGPVLESNPGWDALGVLDANVPSRRSRFLQLFRRSSHTRTRHHSRGT